MEFNQKKRTEIIIEEIEHWKEHKLLPCNYCDFLLTLYTKGGYENNNVKQPEKIQWLFILRIIVLILLLPIAFSIVYLLELQVLWQTGVFLLFITFTYWSILSYKKAEYTYGYNIAFFIFLCLILLFSLTLTMRFFSADTPLNVVIMLNLVVWLLFSYYKRIKLIFISSIFGMIALIVYIFY